MNCVIIPLGYNSCITRNLLRNRINLTYTPLLWCQININYLLYLFEKKFNVINDLYYQTETQNKHTKDAILDKNFPKLGSLFMSDFLKNKESAHNCFQTIHNIIQDDSIKKIFMYNTDPMGEDFNNFRSKIHKLVDILKQYNGEIHISITSDSELSVPNIFTYQLKKTSNIEGDTHSWDNIISNIVGNKQITCLKPKRKINIAIINAGQWRCNHTGYGVLKDPECGRTINKYLIDQIKAFDLGCLDLTIDHVDMFISTDDLNLESTHNYYKNIKNIFLSKTDTIYNNSGVIQQQNYGNQLQKEMYNVAYNKMKSCEQKYDIYTNIWQWCRVLSGLNLLLDYEKVHDFKYDIIIRIRPDIIFTKKINFDMIYELCASVLNGYEKIFMDTDWFAIGTSNTMKHYCQLIKNYGEYEYTKQEYDFDCNGIWFKKQYYNIEGAEKWNFSSEVQLTEHMLSKYSDCPCHNIFEKAKISVLSNIRHK